MKTAKVERNIEVVALRELHGGIYTTDLLASQFAGAVQDVEAAYQHDGKRRFIDVQVMAGDNSTEAVYTLERYEDGWAFRYVRNVDIRVRGSFHSPKTVEEYTGLDLPNGVKFFDPDC